MGTLPRLNVRQGNGLDWLYLKRGNEMIGKFTPVWVESMNGVNGEAIYCPFAVDFCEHFRECKGECDHFKHPAVYVCQHIEDGVCTLGHFDFASGNCHKCPDFSPIPIPHILEVERKETKTKSKIVLIEPGKEARITEIELSLENMQKTVGGLIQAVYPWKDEVALVCNDEGKNLELPLNRALTDENGQVYDIVAGTFFICGLTEDNFGSLTDEQAALYLEKFRDVQMFLRGTDGKLRILVHREVKEEL